MSAALHALALVVVTIYTLHCLQHVAALPNSYQSCCVNPKTLSEPVLNTLLFPADVCPIKTPDAICEAAAERFGLPRASLFPRKVKSIHSGDKAEYVVAKSNADVGVVSVGCCFNVYPNVKAGSPLSTNCSNEIVGDGDLTKLFIRTVMVGGSLQWDTGDTDGTVWVGKDWLGVGPVEIDTDDNDPLVIGGCIALSSQRIGGFAYPATLSTLSRRVPRFELRDVDPSYISHHICQVSQECLAQRPNGEAKLDLVGRSEYQLTLICKSGAYKPCVIYVPPINLAPAELLRIEYDFGSAPLVKVNFAGETIDYGSFLFNVFADFPVVFNFYEATYIRITAQQGFSGSLLAPLARTVTLITSHVRGFVWVGPLDSIVHFADSSTTITYAALPTTSTPRKEVVLCDCLCKGEKGATGGGEGLPHARSGTQHDRGPPHLTSPADHGVAPPHHSSPPHSPRLHSPPQHRPPAQHYVGARPNLLPH